MYRNNNDAGWRCAVKVNERERARYDRDPVYRITKNLKNDALKRRQTIERRRAALNGALSDEG